MGSMRLQSCPRANLWYVVGARLDRMPGHVSGDPRELVGLDDAVDEPARSAPAKNQQID